MKSYFVSDEDADLIAYLMAYAFIAHYQGDEDPSLRPVFDPRQLSPWGHFVFNTHSYVLDGLWTDLYPADNNTSFPLD